MATAFRNVKAAMTTHTGQEPLWSDLMAELLPAISCPLTWQAEGLLLAILRFEGRLRLAVSSDLPHSMPPEDMLKSLAAQALGRWTGPAYLQEMERVRATTQSSSLSSLVRDVIQKKACPFADCVACRLEAAEGGEIAVACYRRAGRAILSPPPPGTTTVE
jgi:hypothetical protein